MRLRLSTKLVTSIVLIQALMLGILVWNSARQFSSSHAELLQQHSAEKSKLLATTLAPAWHQMTAPLFWISWVYSRTVKTCSMSSSTITGTP